MNRTHRKTESNPQPDAGILVCCYCETHVPEASAYVVGQWAVCRACCQWHGLPAPHDDVFLPLRNDEGGKDDDDQRAGEREGGDAVALRE